MGSAPQLDCSCSSSFGCNLAHVRELAQCCASARVLRMNGWEHTLNLPYEAHQCLYNVSDYVWLHVYWTMYAHMYLLTCACIPLMVSMHFTISFMHKYYFLYFLAIKKKILPSNLFLCTIKTITVLATFSYTAVRIIFTFTP